jgi:GNAT superfamily N-acetyltransferase
MARTRDPHAAAIKSWQTRRGRAGSGSNAQPSSGDWASKARRSVDRKIEVLTPKGLVGADKALSGESIRALTNGRLGKEDIADLAGALPGSEVTIEPEVDYVGGKSKIGATLYVRAKIMKDGKQIGHLSRSIDTKFGVIYNIGFRLDDEYQGQGIGTKAFALQVESAVKHGFEEIHATCERGDGWNGYYTWARLGFDGRFIGESVHDLMMKHGREWWKENGRTFHGTFDLSEGSISRRVFDGYMRLKGMN